MTRVTTLSSGKRLLDRDSFPMRLWSKAIQGFWSPEAIDFTRDRRDWEALPSDRRERILQLCALFQVGEEAVTHDLLPLIHLVASEGRLEEEMYLTSFLWEEAKHFDLFDRFFGEVTGDPGDLSRYWHPSYRRIFTEELPTDLLRLETDRSPEAQVRASVTYNIVIEGMMAETGYYLFQRMLGHNRILPGMQQAIAMLRRDESRHIAFGVHFISRLIVEHGNRAYRAFLERMGELKPIVEDSTRQYMDLFDGSHAFGIDRAELARFSEDQSAGRLQRIVRARTQTLREIRASPALHPDAPVDPGLREPAGLP